MDVYECENSRELPEVCVLLCHSLVSRLVGDTLLPPPLIFWKQQRQKEKLFGT